MVDEHCTRSTLRMACTGMWMVTAERAAHPVKNIHSKNIIASVYTYSSPRLCGCLGGSSCILDTLSNSGGVLDTLWDTVSTVVVLDNSVLIANSTTLSCTSTCGVSCPVSRRYSSAMRGSCLTPDATHLSASLLSVLESTGRDLPREPPRWASARLNTWRGLAWEGLGSM